MSGRSRQFTLEIRVTVEADDERAAEETGRRLLEHLDRAPTRWHVEGAVLADVRADESET